MLTFIAQEDLRRAVMVMDIALQRGCPYQKALSYAVESLDGPADLATALASRMVEKHWQKQMMQG